MYPLERGESKDKTVKQKAEFDGKYKDYRRTTTRFVKHSRESMRTIRGRKDAEWREQKAVLDIDTEGKTINK